MTIEPARTVDDTGAASLAPAAVADLRPAPTVGGSRLSTRFWLATIGAASVVGLALALMFHAPLAALSDLIPALVAAAILCVALLARLRAPGLAWASLVVSSLVAATIPISFSRAADPGAMEIGQWLVVAGRSTYAVIVTLVIAALYATRPERQAARRVTTLAMVLVAWLSAGCVIIVLLVVNGARADPRLTWVDIATRPTALFVDAVLLLAAFGVAGDVRAAALRADARLGGAGGGGLAPRQVPIAERVRATLRELVPGEADAGAAAVDAERLRLAGDLHAVVLPSLRRAIAEVEGGGPVEALADRLRAVDLELERLMADRWPLVLESFGLVEALEDLAERTEAGAGVQVGLEIEGDSGRPRPDVERTAWRIAQVALDNAIRHAAAEVVTLTVSVAPDKVTLQIADDGQGIDPATAAGAVRSGARGLADLARRASAVGGSVAVAPGAAGGTVVRFDWPA